jgi:TP901 family phage tail tape measure protein
MARYGGGSEDFRDDAARLEAMRGRREEQIRKEVAYEQQLERTAAAETEAQRRTEVKKRARREAIEVEERGARVADVGAAKVRLDTDAIEENTRARQRNADAQRRQQAFTRSALRGAADPFFATAVERFGQQPSQYQMRREFGIGQQRAARIQEALSAGLVPQQGVAPRDRPLTRVNAALQGIADADADYEEARRNYTNTIRRKSATEQDRLVASQERDAAKQRQAAARIELDSARKGAAVDETIRRDKEEAARRPGTELIRHPTLYGQPGYGEQQAIPPRRRAMEELTPPGVAERRLAEREGRSPEQLHRLATATNSLAEKERLYVAALSDEQRAHHFETYEQAERARRGQAEATEAVRRSTRAATAELGTSSLGMRRHGALTAEWIQAAMRGETTMRELGFQVSTTIGKFAGWTAAATAVYGTAAALGRLGRGAIDSASGVEQVRRVVTEGFDRGGLQQSFRDLADDFNVPITAASDAVYRMGQVFHEQSDAVLASRAALYSFKVGEVDVATSTQNLIAIVNGFGLSAQDLNSVFDQINQAQNRFGIRIADTEAGLAKAAGTYRNAGGDLNYLLGLFIAIQKATGRSGQEIGTGIARGVNQIRQVSNQQRLREQGVEVDPDNFQRTIQSAMQAAQAGGDLQQIATGLLGNQYARLISPVLRDQTLLNKALQETTPARSQGSAQKELAKVLSQVDEQIRMVGVNLERLGSALAQAGFFDVFGVLLKTLNGVLDVTTEILDVFNQLPDPIRQGLVYMGQLYVALAAVRRLGVGGALGAVAHGGDDRRLKALAIRGSRDQLHQLESYSESVSAQRSRQALETEARRRDVGAFDRRYAAMAASGRLPLKGTEERLKLEAQRVKMEVELQRATAEGVRLQGATRTAKQMQLVGEQELNRLRQMEAAEVRSHLLAQGAQIPADFAAPSTRGAVHPNVAVPPRYPVAPAIAGRPRDVLAYIGQVERATEGASAAARGTARASAAVRRWDGENRRLGFIARGGARALDATASGLNRAGDAFRTAQLRASSLGGRLSGFFRGFGAFDAALAAVIIGMEAASYSSELQRKQEEISRLLQKQATSMAEYNRQLREARKIVADIPEVDLFDPTESGGTELLNKFARTGRNMEEFLSNAFAGLGDTLTGKTFSGDYEAPQDRRERLEKEARNRLEEERVRRQLQEEARERGGPVPLQAYEEVQRAAEKDARLRRQGLISQAEFDRRMEEHQVELLTVINPSADKLRQNQRALRALERQQASRRDFVSRFGGAPADELEQQIALSQAKLSQVTGRSNRFRLAEYEAATRFLLQQLRQTNTPEALEKYYQALDAYFEFEESRAQAIFDSAMLHARSEDDRVRAFRDRERNLRRLTRVPGRAVRGTLRERREARGQLESDREELRAVQNLQRDLRESGPVGDLAAQGLSGRARGLRERVRRDTRRLRRIARTLGNDTKEYAEALARRRDDLERLKQEEYADRVEGRGVEQRIALAGVDDPTERARIQMRFARRNMEDARRVFGGESRQFRQEYASYLEARAGLSDAAEDDARQLLQLNLQIAQARAEGDPVRQAQLARQYAARARAQAKNEVERKQAELDAILADNQLRDAIRDREQARFEYLESLTEDPVRQAVIRRTAARRAVRGTQGADRYRALANVREANRAVRDARVESARDDIEFNLDMERITREQAIDQYRSLLRTHKVGKETRRDILRRIKALQREADGDSQGFALAVSEGIRLPTLYDVRRALGPIRDGAAQARGINMNSSVEVNVTVTDPNAAGAVFDAIDRATGTTLRANARSAGLRLG